MNVEIYHFRENDMKISGEKHHLIELARALREAEVEGTLSDLAYQIEYEFDIDGVRSYDNEYDNKYPCDYLDDCPYNATGGYDCRNFCGLGVDENGEEEEDCEADVDDWSRYEIEYVKSSSNRDYSPSNPWDAPGMSVKDFI